MNLELFHKEFQSIILQLIHNILLHLSVALNISYSLLSAAELRDGITKQSSTYVWRVFWIPFGNAKQSRLSARPEPTQHKYWRRYVALNVWLFKDITLSDSLLSLAFATRWNAKHPPYVSTRFFCNYLMSK